MTEVDPAPRKYARWSICIDSFDASHKACVSVILPRWLSAIWLWWKLPKKARAILRRPQVVTTRGDTDMRVPILLNHDHTKLLGSLQADPCRPERLVVRFIDGVTRDQFFQIFPGAGMVVIEGELSSEVERVKVAEILEFSLCPVAAKPA
jgi:hypothetical protein